MSNAHDVTSASPQDGSTDGKSSLPEKPVRVFRTTDILSILGGIPGSVHMHYRAAIETTDEVLVFQEATIAALVRAYISVKTHPTRRAIYLKGDTPKDRKKKYAAWQMMEQEITSGEAEAMLKDILGED